MRRYSPRKGQSYAKRVTDINAIYDRYAHLGVCNREIWLRYVYPIYAISERTFYNLLKAPVQKTVTLHQPEQLTLF